MPATLYIFIALFACLLIGIPIAFSIGIATLSTLLIYDIVPLSLMAQKLTVAGDSFPLLAIPYFMLAGEIMARGGISEKLVGFGKSIVGSATGSLGIVTVICCAIFAAISGSGPATVAAIGGIMVPYMVKDGYEEGYASTLAAVGGTLGPIIPPSVCFIMYGVVASVSITDLFLSGVIPGILIMFSLCILTYCISRKYGYGVVPKEEKVKPTLSNIAKSFWDAKWAVLMPVIILGGIYGGFFTPTEAAVVACAYGLIISLFVTREMSWRELPEVLGGVALTMGSCVIMVGCAVAFGEVMTIMGIPKIIADFLTGITSSKLVALILIDILLLIVGCFFETLSAILILAPILLNVVTTFGVDKIHFGLIMVTAMVIGQVTPPVGINLFVGSRILGIKVEKMFKWLPIFLAVMVLDLLIVTFIPQLSLFLLG